MSAVARIAAFAAACVAGLIAFGTGPVAAQAAPGTPKTVLMLTVTSAEGSYGAARAAALQCSPAGGSHPAPVAACGALQAVNGDFRALQSQDDLCTKEYRPVTATVVGFWQGRPLTYQATFPNHCLLLDATGDVFDF